MDNQIVELFSRHGVHLKQARGDELRTQCIFHEDKDKYGHLYVNQKDAVYFCLAAETSVLTWDGYRPIGLLAGTTQRLLTSENRWVNAPIVNFGQQRLLEIDVTRNKVTKTIRATPEHRWFIRTSNESRYSRVGRTTEQLKPGDRLSYVRPSSRLAQIRPSTFGAADGIVYGDGTLTHKGASVDLWGDKNLDLLKYFNGSYHYAIQQNDVDGVKVVDLPARAKKAPNLDESPSYLYGWLAGYFAADGDITQDGTVSINSADKASLELVQAVSIRLGIGTTPIKTYERTGFGGVSTIYRLSFFLHGLSEEFFLIQEHKDRFNKLSPTYARYGWKVLAIRDTGVTEDVYCAVVDTTHDFVLEDYILTGNCHVCGEKGNGVTLAKYYGDTWVNEETGEIAEYFDKFRLYAKALDYYQEQLLEHPDIYKYLKHTRGLKPETIDRSKLGYAPMTGLIGHLKDLGFTFKEMKQSGLVREDGQEFFRDKIIIPYLTSGHCVQLRGKQIGGKYLTPGGEEARLFGWDTVKDADEVVIAEGEFDALIVRQLGYPCVAVPGARNFKEEWVGWFEGYRRIYICYDADDPGEEGAERTKKILGKRARIVKLPKPDNRDSLDLNDWFLEGGTFETFTELLHDSEGRRLQRASEIRKRWHDQKEADDGIYFGLHPRWDHILKPGFLPGQLVTMLGKTGSGKTVTMLNIAYQNLHIPQLMIELEQTAEELYERMRRISLFYNPRLSDDEIDAMWQNVAICDENKLNGRDFEDLLHEFEEDEGFLPKLVYIDYLGYFARGYRGEEYARLSDAVMDMKAMAKRHRVVIFSPHQVNRTARDGKPLESDMARGSGVIEETSDFCFALWKPYEAENNDGAEPGEVKVKVLKSRHGGKGTQFGLYMAPQSLAIVPNDNVALRNAVMNEFQQFEKGYLWSDIHEARKLTWRPLNDSK